MPLFSFKNVGYNAVNRNKRIDFHLYITIKVFVVISKISYYSSLSKTYFFSSKCQSTKNWYFSELWICRNHWLLQLLITQFLRYYYQSFLFYTPKQWSFCLQLKWGSRFYQTWPQVLPGVHVLQANGYAKVTTITAVWINIVVGHLDSVNY